jgi:Uma2 family endonuclease
MSTKTEATVEDLYRVPENGKAEIVNGELVLMSPTGGVLGRASGEIYVSLREYERRMRNGYAFPDKNSQLLSPLLFLFLPFFLFLFSST